jgi:hypothetical protein
MVSNRYIEMAIYTSTSGKSVIKPAVNIAKIRL